MIHSSFWNIEWIKQDIYMSYQINLREPKAVQHFFSLAPIWLETSQK